MIDELHFGEQAIMCDAVLERYGEAAYFVGYTGTPRAWSEFTRVADFGFKYLVDRDYLARPALRCPLIDRHEFEPVTLEVIHGGPGYEALEGLELNPE